MRSSARLSTGKLPLKDLKRLLKRYAPGGPGLVVGPSVGIDSAVIDLGGEEYLLAKTDPITFVAEDAGTYAIHINANDIAVMGGTPRWFLAAILLPEAGSTVKSAEAIFSQLGRTCRALGIVLSGGHTEVTPAVNTPVVVGQMLGVVGKGGLVTSSGASPGDDLLLTKGISIEGTSIIARELGEGLVRNGAFSAAFIKRCRNFLKKPGISIAKEASVMLGCGRVHAMHDPTEGGLATGVHELAIASGTGALIDGDAIPVFDETARLAAHLGIEPIGLIASGALLAAVHPEDTAGMIKTLSGAGIMASRIGVVTRKKDGVRITRDGKAGALGIYEKDEITRVL